jgi:hypothetical protein
MGEPKPLSARKGFTMIPKIQFKHTCPNLRAGEAFDMGYAAWIETTASLNDNPFGPYSGYRKYWRKGWLQAVCEYESLTEKQAIELYEKN